MNSVHFNTETLANFAQKGMERERMSKFIPKKLAIIIHNSKCINTLDSTLDRRQLHKY